MPSHPPQGFPHKRPWPRSRRGTSRLAWGFALLACCVTVSPASAEDDPDQEGLAKVDPAWEARTTVRLLVLGRRGHEQIPSLETLIDSALDEDELGLTFETRAPGIRSFIERTRRDASTLLIGVVDTRRKDEWRVYVVDAARGRAAARRLPEGRVHNQATVEAVASIVVSATTALRDGHELAAEPVDQVIALDPETAPTEPMVPAPNAPFADAESREAAPPSNEPPAFRLGAGAGPLVVMGWSPEASLGGRAFVDAQGKVFAAALGFEATLPARFEQRDKSGFEIATLAGTLAPCVRYRPLAACSVLRLAHVSGRGFGVDEPREATGLFTQVGLRLSLVRLFGDRFETAIFAELARTLSPASIRLDGNEVYSMPPFSLMLGLDLSASLFVARTKS